MIVQAGGECFRALEKKWRAAILSAVAMPGTLTPEMLGLYAEPRSRSNVYNRQRLELKQALLAYAGSYYDVFPLGEAGMEIASSDHVPSLANRKCVDRQWVFFSRGKAQRELIEQVIDTERTLRATIADPTPYLTHAFVALDVGAASVSMAVYLHYKAWVDRENLLKRLERPDERERLAGMIRALPEEYVVEVDGAPPARAAGMTAEGVAALRDAFRESQGFWKIGLVVDGAKAAALGEDLWEVFKVAFLLLMPVYEVAAWSPEGDFVSLGDKRREIEERRREIALRHEKELTELAARRERERAEREQRHAELVEEKREELEMMKVRWRAAWKPAAESAKEAAPPPLPAPQPPAQKPVQQPAHRPARPEPPKPAVPPPAAAPAVKKEPPREKTPAPAARPGGYRFGDRVEIREGAFRGKWGIVQEVDTRGRVKVILGSMVARLSLDGITPAR